MTYISDNIEKINSKISKHCKNNNRLPNSVTLLAVSKTKPIEAIEQAYQAGQRAFGENYLQEAVNKVESLAHLPDIQWHFIGPIQSNKTKPIAENFTWVHSVERSKIATRLNEHRCSKDTPLNICLQVNISEETSKSGVSVEELPALAQHVNDCKNLCFRGLMAIPAKENAQQSFTKMQQLFKELQLKYPTMDTLSMGMSGDIEQAIAAGSTMVRIGTAIFGQRQ